MKAVRTVRGCIVVLVNVESLVIGFLPMPSVITLRSVEPREDIGDDLVLPIWIGTIEATSIAAALEGHDPGRPVTHTLAVELVKSLGGTISRVVIDRVVGTTFYATIYMRCPNGMFTRVDARPSDAIALAARADVPLFVEEDVMKSAACPRSFVPGQEERVELEEFDKFIERVEPEDFVTHGNE